MKTFTKTLALALTILGFYSADTFAQPVGATATATATIVTPISILNTANMNFGNVSVGTTTGTVVLSPAGARTSTGGIVLPTGNNGTVTAAGFTASGQATYFYTITLPASVTLQKNGSTELMTVDTFTTSLGLTPPQLGVGGNQAFTVGATLSVGAGQASGTYTSTAPFTVTVNYN